MVDYVLKGGSTDHQAQNVNRERERWAYQQNTRTTTSSAATNRGWHNARDDNETSKTTKEGRAQQTQTNVLGRERDGANEDEGEDD